MELSSMMLNFGVQNIFKVPVTAEQLSLILTTLKYDGILEHAVTTEQEGAWQISRYKLPDETPFTSFPCGVYPVSLVSPSRQSFICVLHDMKFSSVQ